MITITNLSNNTSITVIPSAMTWSLNNVNAPDSGRDYTGYMYTNRVTQKRKLELEFSGFDWKEVSDLLKAINSEYCSVKYPDMLSGTMETRTFYAGDQEAPVYIWWNGQKICSTLKFNLIER